MSMQRPAVSESAFRGRGATAWGRVVLVAAIVALLAGLLPTPAVQPAAAGTSRRADAAVLVNSASPGFADFSHYVKPYLDHFGFAYTTLDIATAAIPSTIGEYAVIVIGHRGLDTADAYLDATEEGFLSHAVSSGAGLVNFDNDVASGGAPRYAFINDVFGFGYAGATSGSGLVFPGTGHYITAQHAAGSSLGTGSMNLAGITLPVTGYTAVVTTGGGAPVVAAGTYGAGRAVQFGSYDWMRIGVLGPMYGADDLVWRSIVWAARKPFVMQGLPPFVTMRVDDESGPFNWMHVANEFGIKPWAGLFYHNVDDVEAADLSALTNSGDATVSIHAKNGSFFYFDHGSGDYDDATVAANFAEGTAWHAARDIPISKYVLPHYYEFGTNVFQGLADWGVEFVGTQMEPGNGYGAPWIMNGPFRTFETGGSGGGVPQYYADFMTAPGESELDDQFFNCVTEIRDDGGYEWYPNPVGDLPGTIARGTRHLERSFDTMALATLFTHAYYIPRDATGMTAWRATLQGIMDNIAAYQPIPVTMDYACQYVRATRTADIASATFDPLTKQLSVDFTGAADMATKYFVFTDGNGQFMADAPAFTGSHNTTFTLPGPLDHVTVSPEAVDVVAGATQQFTATAYDAENNVIPSVPFTWSLAATAAGTLTSAGLFTAGATPGSYPDAVVAGVDSVEGRASVTVTEPILDHFTFSPIQSPKYTGSQFTVTITAQDAAGNRVITYNGSAELSDTTGSVTPTSVSFVNGVFTGPITIAGTGTGVTLTASDGDIEGTSAAFDVGTLAAGPYTIWNNTTPSATFQADPEPVELGVRFRSSIDGEVTGLRFFKQAADTGPHVGHLWSNTGEVLATAPFVDETASGWQEVLLSTPVPIEAGVTYVASYHTTAGYTPSRDYFTVGFDSPPLRALADGEDGGNAPFVYDKDAPGGVLPAFPSQPAYQASNYWVDVIVARPGDKTLSRIEVSPDPATVATQGTRQFTARAFYADGSEMADPPVTWMVDNGGGTISATGLFAAGTATGTFTDTIVASLVGVRGTATVEVMPRILHHFVIATVASPQHAGVPFGVSITARDMDGLLVTGYTGTASLSDLTGTVSPASATFTNGTWAGSVTIGSARASDRLTAADGYANGQSNAFDVVIPPEQFSIWGTTAATGGIQHPDPNSVELGTRFRSSMDGQVTALRFWKGAGNNSTHVGHLWSNTGTLLATASFTSETASGWQVAQLTEPIAITKDTTYVVSYHTISYYKTEGYFTSQSYTNGPLTALQSGVLTGTPAPNGNGLYAYGTSAAFPNNTHMATNYWADVVFEPEAQLTPLTATVTVLARPYDGATPATITGCTLGGVVEGEDVTCVYSGATAAFDTAAAGTSKAVSATGLTLGGADKANYSFAGTGSGTGTITPVTLIVTPRDQSITHGAPVPAPSFYTFDVSGFVNGESAASAAGYVAPTCTSDFATTTPASPPTLAIGCSGGSATNYTFDTSATAELTIEATIFGSTSPDGFYNDLTKDPQSVELGTRFRSSLDGQITAIRFWKDAGNTASHVGHLWSNTGTLLGTAAFTNETASGWQTAQLSEPVAITKDTNYVVSYHTITYHKTEGYFTSQSHTNGPLTAMQAVGGVKNGVYEYGSGTPPEFPDSSYNNTNYWADVVFEATPNTAPVAVADTYTTNEDTSLVLEATKAAGLPLSPVDNDTDVDGDPLTVTAVSNAAGGTVSLVAGTITFVPTADLCGPRAYGFDYTVSDDDLADTGHADVTITCVNDPPVAVDDDASGTEDTLLAIPAATLLADDSDGGDGGTLSLTAVDNATGGTVAIDGDDVEFTPTANLCGDDVASFEYTVSDGTDTDTGLVTIDLACVDDAPVAVDDTETVLEDATATAIDVLTNDTDVDTGPKSITAVTQPANGTVVITGGGTGLTYAPNANYCNGGDPVDTFTYTLNGGSVATVRVTVTCVDDAPVAVDDTETVLEDATATAIDVLTNDTDVDTGPKSITAVTQPANGTVVITGGGTGLTYAPNANYCNGGDPVDTFTYTLNGGSVATVRVTVTCVDDAPVVVLSGDFSDVTEGESRSFTYSVTDIDSTPIVTESCGANATRTDTPTPNHFSCTFPDGPATTTVNVTANNGPVSGDDPHTVTIANVAPTVQLSGGATANEGQTKSFSFSVIDPGPDTFSLVDQSCSANGTLSNATFNSTTGAGSFDCTFLDGPAVSSVSVEVKDSDNASGTDTKAVSVANVAPVVTLTGDAEVNEGKTKTYSFTTSDPGADTFAVVTRSCGANGTPSDDTFDAATGAGSFKCTFPDGDATSTVSVQVKDSDEAESNTDTILVDIANVAPVFGAFPANAGGQYSDPIDADTTTTGIQALAISATDAGDDTISFSIDRTACEGGQNLPDDLVLTDNGDGTAKITGRFDVIPTTYAPCIAATDSDDKSAAQTITITVTPEDAMIVDIEPTFVEIDGTDGDKDSVPLTATFVEASDGNPSSTLDTFATAYGATDVKFDLNPVGTNGQQRICTDNGVPTAGGGVGCTVGDLLSDVYEIDATIQSAWFAGDGIGTIAVFDPANGYSTGGGHFIWADAPSGSPWADPDPKVNFGFTGKKLNKNVKGSVLTVIHTDVGPYVIKTNAFTGMANAQVKDTEYWYTSMTGKATYSVPEGQVNPYCSPGLLKCGNFTIIMYAEDRAEPGAGVDTYKLKLIAPNKKVVFDMALQTIAAGNVQVPHQAAR